MKATYRWDELRSLSGTFSYMPFTDGNQRFNAGAVFTQKMINVPHFDLFATGEVFASHNNRPAAPYYNPDSDLTVDAGLLAEHMIWRRYEDSWVQALSVNAGVYSRGSFPLQRDRHSELRAPLALRPVHGTPLWNTAQTQGLRWFSREQCDAYAWHVVEIF